MLCHDFQNLFTVVAKQLTSNKAALQVSFRGANHARSLIACVSVQIAAASTIANWSLLLLNRSATVAELGPREDAIRGIIKVCHCLVDVRKQGRR